MQACAQVAGIEMRKKAVIERIVLQRIRNRFRQNQHDPGDIDEPKRDPAKFSQGFPSRRQRKEQAKTCSKDRALDELVFAEAGIR